MPRKLRRAKARTDVLNLNQRGHLCSGHYWWTHFREPEFVDEDHRRAAWNDHRAQLLAEWDRPGTRPVALWQYDFGSWEQYGESESEAVHRLLKKGDLEGCRLNGLVPIEDEVAQIEADWRHWIAVALLHAKSYEAARELACGIHYGVPVDFFDEHAPAIAAQQEAEARAWRRKRVAMLKNDGHL